MANTASPETRPRELKVASDVFSLYNVYTDMYLHVFSYLYCYAPYNLPSVANVVARRELFLLLFSGTVDNSC